MLLWTVFYFHMTEMLINIRVHLVLYFSHDINVGKYQSVLSLKLFTVKHYKVFSGLLSKCTVSPVWGCPPSSRKFAHPLPPEPLSGLPHHLTKGSLPPTKQKFWCNHSIQISFTCEHYFLNFCSIYAHVMLIRILIYVQCLQNIVFSIEKVLNGRNHSLSDSHYPTDKKISPAKFPIPSPLNAIWKALKYVI